MAKKDVIQTVAQEVASEPRRGGLYKMSMVAAARFTGLALLFAVASISSALAEDLIGPETVWSPPQDASGGYCSYSQGFGPWKECLAAQGAPVATLKVAELLQGMPHLGLGGVVTKFHELGPIDYAEIEFPSPTRSGFQVAFVNGDVSVITGTSVGSFQAPQDSGTKKLLRIVPNAGPSGRFEVSGYRILPGEVQRFVLTDVLTAGCMGCEVVGISITHLDFQFGRLIGTQSIGWAPYPSPAPLGWPAQALLRGDELQLQIQLNLRGYDAGSMDGVAGGQTEAALVEFREENCLPSSNHLTVAAIQELAQLGLGLGPAKCGPKLVSALKQEKAQELAGSDGINPELVDCSKAVTPYEIAACSHSAASDSIAFKAGQVAYLDGQYEAALDIWIPLADQGDASAQYALGQMLLNGEGMRNDLVSMRKNVDMAISMFLLSAQQGNHKAMRSVAVLYRLGKGLRQNNTEALKWYRLAAERGNSDAMLGLGDMLSLGIVASEDYPEAARWYMLAAREGQLRAQETLGFWYEIGRGVQKDYIFSYMWYSVSGSDRSRNQLERKMLEEDVVEARKRARLCIESNFGSCS